jgi:hypothetical protein
VWLSRSNLEQEQDEEEREEEEEEGGGGEEEGFFRAKSMNQVDAGRDRANAASVRHNDDEPLTPISPCYCTRAARPPY